MIARSFLLACAAAVTMSFAAPAGAEPARCADTAFRIYFAEGAPNLDETARETIAVAERQVAGCAYAALQVRVDPAMPFARERGAAVAAAMHGRAWNAVRIETGAGFQQAAHGGRPAFAEVTISSRPLDAGAPQAGADAGV